MRECKRCLKNSKQHSEKLWNMHQTVLAFGSQCEKLRPITIGCGPTTIGRVHKWNTIKVNGQESPYHIEIIPIHMRCTGCRNSISTNEVNCCYCTNATAYWNFEEGSGNTALDLTSNGNNGTINGATYDTNVPSQSCTLGEYSIGNLGVGNYYLEVTRHAAFITLISFHNFFW